MKISDVEVGKVHVQFLLRIGIDPVYRVDSHDHLRLGRKRHLHPAHGPLPHAGFSRGDRGGDPVRKVVLPRNDAVERILVGSHGVKGRIGVESISLQPLERLDRIDRLRLRKGFEDVVRLVRHVLETPREQRGGGQKR